MQPETAFAGTARYAIRREIGRGGFGVVYEAHDGRTGERVALKALRAVDADGLLAFKHEFRAAAAVTHPNLVTLHELEVVDTTPFFTMELVEGVPMLDWIRPGYRQGESPTFSMALDDGPSVRNPEVSGALDLGRLRVALPQLVRAVLAIHAAGLIHRDIKPSNVLVTPEGRVVLLDFGLVAELAAMNVDPLSGRVGTPAYMAPELGVPSSRNNSGSTSGATSKPTPNSRSATMSSLGDGTGRASAASDWYSVGVLLYEALTGALPFTGGPMQVMEARRLYDPPNPMEMVRGADPELSALCLRLLSRDPAARPTDAQLRRELGLGGGTAEDRVGFFGRKRELAQLRDALWLSRSTTTSIVVHGAPGIGKTALVEQFLANSVRAEGFVLLGRCPSHEAVAFKAVDGVIDAIARVLNERSDLRGPQIAGLAAMFPVLGDVPASEASPRTLHRRAGRALRDILLRMGRERATAVVVDDAQWADEDGSALLAAATRIQKAAHVEISQSAVGESDVDTPRVLIVVLCRSGDLDRSPLVRAMRASGTLASELAVGPLPDSDAKALLSAIGATDHAPILREAKGDPQFLVALARESASGALVSSDRPAILRAVDRDVAGLGPAAGAVMELLAVAGGPVTRSVLAHACPAADGVVFQGLRGLRLIRVHESGLDHAFECFHPRVAEAIVEGLSGLRRGEIHATLGAAMDAASVVDPDARLIHAYGAGDRPRARDLALQLADRPGQGFFLRARLLDLAIECGAAELGDPDLYRRYGDALVDAGRVTEAAESYLRAAEAAPHDAIALRQRAAIQLLVGVDRPRGLAMMREVLERVGVGWSATGIGAVAAVVWLRLRLRMRGMAIGARRPELDPLADALAASTAVALVDPLRGLEIGMRALLAALDSGDPARVARVLPWESLWRANLGDRQGALSVLVHAHRSTDDERTLAFLALARGVAHHLVGEPATAVPALSEAEERFEEMPDTTYGRYTAAELRVECLHRLGRWRDLGIELPRRIREAETVGNTEMTLHLRRRRTELWLVDDRASQALAELQSIPTLAPGSSGAALLDLIVRIETDLYSGATDAAVARIDAAWPATRAARWLVQLQAMDLAYARGRVSLAALASDPRRERLVRADIAALDKVGTDLARGYAAVLEAGLCARAARVPEAVEAGERAEDLLRAAGVAHVQHAIRFRVGEILGADRGAALVASAAEQLAALGVKNPRAIARMYTW